MLQCQMKVVLICARAVLHNGKIKYCVAIARARYAISCKLASVPYCIISAMGHLGIGLLSDERQRMDQWIREKADNLIPHPGRYSIRN